MGEIYLMFTNNFKQNMKKKYNENSMFKISGQKFIKTYIVQSYHQQTASRIV